MQYIEFVVWDHAWRCVEEKQRQLLEDPLSLLEEGWAPELIVSEIRQIESPGPQVYGEPWQVKAVLRKLAESPDPAISVPATSALL